MVSASFLAALGWFPTTEPEIIGYETSLASDTRVAETSDDDERWSETDSPGGEVSNVQENIYPAIAPTVDRYLKQKRSALGKVAYVVYAGKDVGVFYNWCVFLSFVKPI